nr:MAG TPA: hypothetical protein [Caudoviricetes sp.]
MNISIFESLLFVIFLITVLYFITKLDNDFKR